MKNFRKMIFVFPLFLILVLIAIYFFSPINEINHTYVGSCSKYQNYNILGASDKMCLAYNAKYYKCKCLGYLIKKTYPGGEDRCIGKDIMCKYTGSSDQYYFLD
jgi:hypothetical protein